MVCTWLGRIKWLGNVSAVSSESQRKELRGTEIREEKDEDGSWKVRRQAHISGCF
jgi:hypothetical protein